MRYLGLLLLSVLMAPAHYSVLGERISLEKAQQMIRAEVFRESPQMNPEAQFPVREITPEALWGAMQTQAYEIIDGVREGYVYLIQSDSVCSAGWVTSMAVADLDRNGRAELYCASSWGSGILRSGISAFQNNDTGLDAIASDYYEFMWVYLRLEAEADTAVAIHLALPYEQGVTFARGPKLGDVHLVATAAGPRIVLRLEEPLPTPRGGKW